MFLHTRAELVRNRAQNNLFQLQSIFSPTANFDEDKHQLSWGCNFDFCVYLQISDIGRHLICHHTLSSQLVWCDPPTSYQHNASWPSWLSWWRLVLCHPHVTKLPSLRWKAAFTKAVLLALFSPGGNFSTASGHRTWWSPSKDSLNFHIISWPFLCQFSRKDIVSLQYICSALLMSGWLWNMFFG